VRRTTIATAGSARGDVTLLRRDDDGALELRVNGVFVMDTAEASSEIGLADIALARLDSSAEPGQPPQGPVRLLVGGLGLGFTLRRLAESEQVDEIVVVELEGALLDWHRRGLVPATAAILADPRLAIVEGDIRAVVEAARPGWFDALIVDVDNGPGFLVYDDNAAVYRVPFLTAARRALRPGGSVVVWTADESVLLADALSNVFGAVDHHQTVVRLGVRDERYHAYAAAKVEASTPCPVP